MGKALQRRDMISHASWTQELLRAQNAQMKPGKSVCSPETGTDLRVQIVAPCCSHSWSWNQLHRFDPQWSGFRRVKNVYMQLEWAFPPVRCWNRNNLRELPISVQLADRF